VSELTVPGRDKVIVSIITEGLDTRNTRANMVTTGEPGPDDADVAETLLPDFPILQSPDAGAEKGGVEGTTTAERRRLRLKFLTQSAYTVPRCRW